MDAGDALRKNLEFWHWYPRFLCEGLSEEQLRWQPPDHANNIMFTIWHAFRAEDGWVNRLAQRDTVLDSEGWRERLRVPEDFPSGDALNREHIAALNLDPAALLDYGDAVCRSVQVYLDGLSEAEAEEQVPIPILERVFGRFGSGTRLDSVTYISMGHLCAHLGEVQYIKGLMGLKGTAI